MKICPICETKVDEKFDYCRKCAWEFEYFFDELDANEVERYEYRLRIYFYIYRRSISK